MSLEQKIKLLEEKIETLETNMELVLGILSRLKYNGQSLFSEQLNKMMRDRN